MNNIAQVEDQSSLDIDLKRYSCLICRQRKVKCDRNTPCNNCIKNQKQCSFIPPVRGRRKRTTPTKEGLHTKLRRYEELLKSSGVRTEPDEDANSSASGSELVSQAHVKKTHAQYKTRALSFGSTPPKLVTTERTSRYFDRYYFLCGAYSIL
jgi:hypothetical protein